MGQDDTVDGIMKNGVIHTRYFNNWHQLSKEDKDKVIADRVHTGTARPGKGPKVVKSLPPIPINRNARWRR